MRDAVALRKHAPPHAAAFSWATGGMAVQMARDVRARTPYPSVSDLLWQNIAKPRLLMPLIYVVWIHRILSGTCISPALLLWAIAFTPRPFLMVTPRSDIHAGLPTFSIYAPRYADNILRQPSSPTTLPWAQTCSAYCWARLRRTRV